MLSKLLLGFGVIIGIALVYHLYQLIVDWRNKR